MKRNQHYYNGTIEGYKEDLARAREAGVNLSFARLNQFEDMLEDFKELEDFYNAHRTKHELHSWNCYSTGLYESLYKCTKCGEKYCSSIDDLSKQLPTTGCKGENTNS